MVDRDPQSGKFVGSAQVEAQPQDASEPRVGDYRQTEKGYEVYVVEDDVGGWVDGLEAASGYMRRSNFTKKTQALREQSLQGARADDGDEPRLGLRSSRRPQNAFEGSEQSTDGRREQSAAGQAGAVVAPNAFQPIAFRQQRAEEDDDDYRTATQFHNQQQSLLKNQFDMLRSVESEKRKLTETLQTIEEEREQAKAVDELYNIHPDFDEDVCKKKFSELPRTERERLSRKPYADALESIHIRHIRGANKAPDSALAEKSDTPFQESGSASPRNLTPANRPLTPEELSDDRVVGERYKQFLKSKKLPIVGERK